MQEAAGKRGMERVCWRPWMSERKKIQRVRRRNPTGGKAKSAFVGQTWVRLLGS